jgi:hypothetical protein
MWSYQNEVLVKAESLSKLSLPLNMQRQQVTYKNVGLSSPLLIPSLIQFKVRASASICCFPGD